MHKGRPLRPFRNETPRFTMTWDALDAVDRECAEKEIRALVSEYRESGVTRIEASIAICETLLFRFRVVPSPSLVSQLGGWGSKSDIPDDVRAFWARYTKTQRLSLGGAELPAKVSAQLGTAVEAAMAAVVEAARDGALAELAQDRERMKREHQDALAQAQTYCAHADARSSAAHERAERAEQGLQRAQRQADEANQARESAERDLADARARLSALESELASVRNEHQAVVARISQELEAERLTRDRDRETMDGQIRFLMVQRDGDREELRGVRAENELLKAAAEVREKLVRARIAEASEANGKLAILVPDLASAKEEVDRLRERIQSIETQQKRQTAEELAQLEEQTFCAKIRAELLEKAPMVWAWMDEHDAVLVVRRQPDGMKFGLRLESDGEQESCEWFSSVEECAARGRWDEE